MKNFSIYLLGAMALVATSCEEDAPEAPAMQENPQPEILVEGDITGASAGVLAGTTTVALETAGASIPVFAFTEVKEVPEGAELVPELQLSNTEDFANSRTLEMKLGADGETYTVSDDEWNEAHIALFGKSPKVKTAYYRVPVYLSIDGTKYRYNSTDWYAAAGTVTETCKDAGFVIYDKYYFVGTINDWALAAELEFSHSDVDVYDDPVFTIKLDITEDLLAANNGECWWKIAPDKAVTDQNWDLLYGPEVDGDDNLAGMLIEKGQSGVIREAGKYRLTVNMEEMTYEFEPITRPDYVAVPSNANGWSQDGPRLYWSNKDDKPYFCGAAVVNNNDGGFKFIWDNNWYGGADGKIDPAMSDNIKAPVDGNELYWFTVSTDDMTYTMDLVTSVGVVGGLNGWNADAPVELTPDASKYKWSADVALTGDWKIIINHSWNSNYGGPDVAELTFDGGNIGGFEGNYTVTVDFSGNKPAVIVAPK